MDETNFDDLIYYFKGDSNGKRLDDFENWIKLFEKIESGDMKLEKTYQKIIKKVFKSDLNKIVRGKYESEDKESALQNIKMLYQAREKVVKLLDDYSVIASIHGEGIKILTTDQMLQRLPIALAHVKSGNTFENLLNERRQII